MTNHFVFCADIFFSQNSRFRTFSAPDFCVNTQNRCAYTYLESSRRLHFIAHRSRLREGNEKFLWGRRSTHVNFLFETAFPNFIVKISRSGCAPLFENLPSAWNHVSYRDSVPHFILVFIYAFSLRRKRSFFARLRIFFPPRRGALFLRRVQPRFISALSLSSNAWKSCSAMFSWWLYYEKERLYSILEPVTFLSVPFGDIEDPPPASLIVQEILRSSNFA